MSISPTASKSFADLGISSATENCLTEQGITAPFAIQNLVIPDILEGHDVLAKSPTGSGKTLAFGAPMVDMIEATAKRPSGLVLAPTRELAVQIVEQTRPIAHARALSITAVYGGVGIHAQAKKAARSHIIVATPGRLLDLLERGAFSLQNISFVVLDEADRMLDMGFRPDVERILKRTPSQRQTLLFSATLDGEVGRLAQSYTREPKRHENSPVGSAPDIEHRFVPVAHEGKLDAVIGELNNNADGLTIVFVRTKHGADKLAKKLSKEGLSVDAMHGNKSQSQRTKALARFESGNTAALVATDVAARGIDVSGITRVINFDPPEDHQAYTHRIGRTARAGRSGVGITFVRANEAGDVAAMARELGLQGEFEATGFTPADIRRSGGSGKSRSGRAGGNGRSGGNRSRPPRGSSENGSRRSTGESRGRAGGEGRPNGFAPKSGGSGRPNGQGRSSRPNGNGPSRSGGQGRSEGFGGGSGQQRRSRRAR